MTAPLPEQIAGLLIPMVGRPMLLPNVGVAEIVPWTPPLPRDPSAPVWLLGQLEWRGLQIPMISIELMNSPDAEDARRGSRIAVLNGVGGSRWPFYAVSIQGIPRLVRVYPEEISNEEKMTDKPAFAYQMSVNGERSIVPDLAWVEAQLDRL